MEGVFVVVNPAEPIKKMLGQRKGNTYAAKRSGRSRYCQYSRLGIGSSNDAGRDNRLA